MNRPVDPLFSHPLSVLTDLSVTASAYTFFLLAWDSSFQSFTFGVYAFTGEIRKAKVLALDEGSNGHQGCRGEGPGVRGAAGISLGTQWSNLQRHFPLC